MKVGKKKKLFEQPTGPHPLRALRSAPASAPTLRPSQPPEKFQITFYRISWNHLWSQIFVAKNIRQPTKSYQIIKETSQKKYAVST